ncbi:MAG: 50S ribosomal protein L5 [Kiritimatiellae bacterium]|nr:50S ribosomal protein L5 [Kiritimatiellia bacterium]
MSSLRERYKTEVVKALRESRGYRNPMQVPRLLKIVVNMSVKATEEKDVLKHVAEDLAKITGQKPVITKSRKSISNFKLRAGMPIGAKVTLRGPMMFDFLERLIGAVLPRIRDFRGVPRSFDGRGSYTLGLKEQTLFPEIPADHVKRTQGMDITIVTSAATDGEAEELLKLLGVPFASAAAGKEGRVG